MSTKSRSLIISVILSVTALAGCGSDQPKTIRWDLQAQATANSIDFTELVAMTEKIEVMSGGRFVIKAHPGGTITGGPDIFNAVKSGRIHMGAGWPNWWSGQHPAWAVMNAGPFDFMNIDASLLFFLGGEGTQLANELANPQGIEWRAAWWPGMEFGLLSRKPIRGIDDLNELKVRIGPGLPSEVLSAVSGAYTIPLVPEEIKSALESGALDAVEWTTAAGAWNLGLNSIATHAIVPAIWQPSVLADFLINKQAYEALPDDLKMMLDTALTAYTLTTTVKAKLADFEALENFKNNNTEIRNWSAQDIKRWKAVSEQVLTDYAAKDDFTKRLIEAKKAFKSKYNRYYQYFGPYDQ